MNRIALNIICKNEEHIIGNLLASVRSVVDLVVAVDTGSADDTIAKIRAFGINNRLPTYVFERKFDNFCNSRNYAIDKLIEVVQQLDWVPGEVWGLSIDCDEVLQIAQSFSKEMLVNDLYLIGFQHKGIASTRRSLFRVSGNFRWKNPVHEILEWEDNGKTVTLIPALFIHCESKGGSWKKNIEKKFLKYVELLKAHATEGHADMRTLYYIADSYMAAAEHSKIKKRITEHRLTARGYYIQALDCDEKSLANKIDAYNGLAEAKFKLKEPWPEVRSLLQQAYSLDIRNGEPIAYILRHYIEAKQWNIAYLFSLFAYRAYHGKKTNIWMAGGKIERRIYEWEMLYYHAVCSYLAGRKDDAKLLRKQLKEYGHQHADELSIKDLIRIQGSSPFYLHLKIWRQRIFGGVFRA
jgi:glycosyltransferase involved in cell wall biosynthesis